MSDLARQLVEHPRWPGWRSAEGMGVRFVCPMFHRRNLDGLVEATIVVEHGEPRVFYVDRTIDVGFAEGRDLHPDLTSDATCGILLGWLRNALRPGTSYDSRWGLAEAGLFRGDPEPLVRALLDAWDDLDEREATPCAS